jgi:L-ascorbate metabolism protein UlaG (beta-lactamase superfamily)
MTRHLTALAFGFLLAGTTSAADTSAKVTIRFYGQSFFEIRSSKGTRIVIDPHFIEEYGRKDVSADVILISHEHNDHNQVEAVKNFQRAEIIHGLRVTGKKQEWNPIDKTIRDVHIRSVGVYHDKAEGMSKGKNTIFILEMDGLHIVHLGDLGHLLSEKDIQKIGPVDVLMIPVGGVYALNGSDAKQVVADLKPRLYILPMHYGTPKVFEDLLPPDEFLEEQANVKDNRDPDPRGAKKKPRTYSNELIVDPNSKPAEPVIVLLHWQEMKKAGP